MSRQGGRPRRVTRTAREASTLSSFASSAAVRARMQAQRTRDTAAELRLRRLLHALGLRYRVDKPPLPGLRRRADILFGRSKVAVFVDGCFWHGCARHSQPAKANAAFWAAKIARNVERDRETDSLLAAADWLVIRVWEHEDPTAAASRIAAEVRQRAR